LFENEGIRRVWDKVSEGDSDMVPAPVTGNATPFAFAIQVLYG